MMPVYSKQTYQPYQDIKEVSSLCKVYTHIVMHNLDRRLRMACFLVTLTTLDNLCNMFTGCQNDTMKKKTCNMDTEMNQSS